MSINWIATFQAVYYWTSRLYMTCSSLFEIFINIVFPWSDGWLYCGRWYLPSTAIIYQSTLWVLFAHSTFCHLPDLIFRTTQRASLVAQTVKNPPVIQETWVWSLGWKDPLEMEMAATHSSILVQNSMDRTWRATVHGAAKHRTRLNV